MKLQVKQALLPALITIASLHASAFASDMRDVQSAWGSGDLAGAIHAFEQLPAGEQSRSNAQFIVGACYFKRHDFAHAKPFLQNAAAGQLIPRQRQTATTMLGNIEILERLCPPFQRTYRDGGFSINFCAAKSAWSSLLAAQMPAFLRRAQEGFANESADITFYLFEEREPYDKFYSAWRADGQQQSEKHRGTGGMHMVEFCQYFPNGTKIGASNINDLYSRLMHEYSHALCNTIYGDRFGRDCPQWLNEGMADYFGWKYRPEMYTQAYSLLKRYAKGKTPPTYEELSHSLYSHDESYLISNVLVLELLNGKNVGCFREIIDTARTNGGDFETALKQVTGKDPRAVFAGMVQTYWR